MILLPFYIIAAAAAAASCLSAGWAGWELLLLLPVFIAYFAALLLLYVLFLGLISLFVDRKKPQDRVVPFFRLGVICTVGLINALFRIRIHTEGFEKLPEGRWLYVSNHRAAFDATAGCWALRKHGVAFIMKPAIMKIPIANKFLHKACFMDIDRENDREALKTIIKATQLVKSGETSIAVYPEGTRNPEGHGLLPFRNGVFKIAQRAKVPVVVATVKNSENVVKNFPWRPTDVYLKVCRVITPEEMEGLNTNEIGEEARKCMMQEGC